MNSTLCLDQFLIADTVIETIQDHTASIDRGLIAVISLAVDLGVNAAVGGIRSLFRALSPCTSEKNNTTQQCLSVDLLCLLDELY